MEELKKKIRENKPDISESSITSYANALKQLFYKAHLPKEPLDIKWFNDFNAMKEELKDANLNTRKTTYASILTLHKGNEEIKKLMVEDQKEVNKQIATHKKSDKQEENWLDYNEIKKRVDNKLKLTKALFTSKEKLSDKEYNDIILTMILLLTTGYYETMPPRRNMDMNELKFRNYSNDDNYITKTHFVFNKYKTSKYYGEEKIEIPKEMKPILNNYLRHRKMYEGDYLLNPQGYSENKFKSNDMGKYLNKFFGLKIGTSMLRHIFISHYIDIKKIKDNADKMGHSFKETLEYAKI
jgi:integrase